MENPDIYSQMCSARTVQSDNNGFFMEFFEEVKQSAGEKWLKNYFAYLKTDTARILSIFNDRELCDHVLGILENVKSVYKQKDEIFSSQRRLQAEKLLLTGELNKALLFANQAILRAPGRGSDHATDEGITLALALWTRINVLLEMGEGEKALNDLKLVALNGLNIKQNPEYYLKTARAYSLMGEVARAKIALGVAENFLAGEQAKIEKYRQELSEVVPTFKKSKKLQKPALIDGENPKLKGASNLLQLSEAPVKGKYISARDDLKTGNIILVEDPVAACLHPSFYGTNCYHCFERLFAPVGCLNCSGIAFCSHECMSEAAKTYHKYECQYSDLFIGSGMSILCYIALRIFTQSKSVEDGLILANELISTHCTHTSNRSIDDLLQRGIMAAFLLRCLQKSGYFGIRMTESANPTACELKVATALLGLLQILQFNAHEIYQTAITKEHKFDSAKVIYIGAGLYKTGSYFNHDCNPDVLRYFVGKSIVLACGHPIKAGNAIYENYGPVYTRVNLKERQSTLKARYMFECTCKACTENWPQLQKMDEKMVRLRCTTANCDNLLKFPKDIGKDVRCARCRKNISLKMSVTNVIKAEEIYREAALAMKDQNTEKAIELFNEGIDLFYQVADLPHKDTALAENSLRGCYGDTGSKFYV